MCPFLWKIISTIITFIKRKYFIIAHNQAVLHRNEWKRKLKITLLLFPYGPNLIIPPSSSPRLALPFQPARYRVIPVWLINNWRETEQPGPGITPMNSLSLREREREYNSVPNFPTAFLRGALLLRRLSKWNFSWKRATKKSRAVPSSPARVLTSLKRWIHASRPTSSEAAVSRMRAYARNLPFILNWNFSFLALKRPPSIRRKKQMIVPFEEEEKRKKEEKKELFRAHFARSNRDCPGLDPRVRSTH